ncbi:MAG: CHAT domain-containing tetratricopeptide repeat protein [Planctomycetota bacterium]|nr:CHAT domain-containing tetratricopeptide repeat protein [Planctomycetota bacterium]
MNAAPPDLLDRFLAAKPEDRTAWLAEVDSARELAEAIESEVAHDAARVLEASEAVLEVSPDHPLGPRILRATVTALAYLGRHERAIEVGREARERATMLGDRTEAARALVACMHPRCELGRIDEAIADGERARRELLSLDAAELALRVDLNLGNIRKMQGEAALALAHLDRVLDGLPSDDAIRPHALNAVGECRHVLDDLVAADRAFEEAGRLLGERGGLAAAIVLGNRADVAAREGRIEDALDLFKRARERCEALEADGQAARMSVETGEALATAGMHDEATEILETSLVALDGLGMVGEASRARLALSRLDLVGGRHQRSIDRATAAASGFSSLGNRRGQARAGLVGVEAALAQGDSAEARSRIRILALDSGHDRVADLGRLAMEAEADALEGSWSAAVQAANRSLEIARDLGLVTLVIECLARLSRMELGAGLVDEAIATARDAVEAIEGVRAGFGASRLRTGFLSSRTAAYESLVAGLVQRADEAAMREAFDVMERARHRGLIGRIVDDLPPDAATEVESAAVADLRRRLLGLYAALDDDGPDSQRRARNDIRQVEIDRLEIKLDRLLLEIEDRRSPIDAAMELEDIVDEIPAGAALVEYFVAENRLIAFTVLEGRLQVVPIDVTIGELSKLVTELHFQCRRRLRGRPGPRLARRMQETCDQVLREIHERIVAPLPSDVREVDRWLVVPHGPLVAVPFHALQSPAGHLLDRIVVTTATSAATATRLARTPLQGEGVMVATVSDDRAPSIREEGDRVAAMYESVRRLDGMDAKASSVLSAMERTRVAHLACHGRFLPGSPRSSGLRLSDRWITVRDVRELARTPSVVVLSGCETGLHPQQGANELLGLSRAFAAGGTRTVVASLWSVHDEASTRLMSAMLAAIAHPRPDGEISLGPALREAQLEVRSRNPHPAYWAPFFCAEPQLPAEKSGGRVPSSTPSSESSIEKSPS